jgi:hypothetical protein
MSVNTQFTTSTESPGSGINNGTDTELLPNGENLNNSATTIESNDKLQILIMLPLSPIAADRDHHRTEVEQWDRGLEILPGAQIAVEAINKDPHLLPGYELEIVEKSVDPCIPLEVHSNLNAFVPFAKGSLQNNTIAVLGLFCDRLLRILSPLAGRDEYGLFQLSGTASPLVRGNRERYTHLNFISPSEAAYYETLFVLMREINWKRALVIDEEFFNTNSIRNGSVLTKNLDITYLEYSDLIFTTISEIRRSEKNIVYVSIGAKHMAALLCAAYDNGLVWPHYMWILQDHDVSDLLEEAHKNCTKGKLMEATQNAIVFKFQYEQGNKSKELDTGNILFESYLEEYTTILSESGDNLKHNKFANMMHDSVWAFTFALNHSLDTIASLRDNITVMDFVNQFGRKELTNLVETNLRSRSFEGVSGRVQFNDDYDIEALVSVTFWGDHNTSFVIGYYDQASPSDFMIDQTINLPSDQLPNRYNLIPLPGTILLITVAILCLLLTTIMFILFIKYRHYSEIKATSPYLSMLMFVGTYSILLSAVIQAALTAIDKPLGMIASETLCGSVISGNVMGINLIFCTLLLRMLRIYRIFSYFGKTGKIWSDKVLMLLVVLIVGGDVVLLLIWFNVDPFTVRDYIIYRSDSRPPHYEISQYCTSSNIAVWFALIFGKVGVLFAIVLFLAIKTRKIQRENFKDTKKVNIYIFITVLIIAMLIPVWFLLEGTGNVIGTGIVIYAAFGATGLFCQLMLFAPKVLPPLLRSLGFKVGLAPTNRRKKTIRRSGARNNTRGPSSNDFSSCYYTYDSTNDTYRRSSVYPTCTQSCSHNFNSTASLDSRKVSTVTVLTNLSTVE